MNWLGKKVLVTGAGGFIGSHLVERLVMLGASVRALVRYNSRGSWGWLDHSPLVREVEVVAGDICDADNVLNATEGAEVVFHLAALIAIPYSYVAPHSYIRANIDGTFNALQAARRTGVQRFLHTSTSEVYGTAQYVPIDETHPLQGQSPYSASKIGADKMAEAFHLSFSLPVVTVRPFNTFGPRQSARAVIPTIISQCLGGASTIKLGSLHPTRDLNFVGNTVDGYIAAAESDAATGRTINLGSNHEISVGDLANRIIQLTAASATIESDSTRIRPEKSEVERLLADNSLARELLAWDPRVGLDEGLQRTIEWIRENQHWYRTGTYAI
ncbi:MAG: dTDP-glucose 4,6-dehydratase [Verrucomicrobia bacterium]|jgi:dTDP-glucose 4,6-dehydratase|nr:MAG: dTDP-glucose 4,6-dehydratase [Verrucomicrobiota bacterium]